MTTLAAALIATFTVGILLAALGGQLAGWWDR